MNNALLLILIITGLLALYWVIFGQKKHNDLMREKQEIIIEKERK